LKPEIPFSYSMTNDPEPYLLVKKESTAAF